MLNKKSFYVYVRSKSNARVQISSLIDNMDGHACNDLDITELFSTYCKPLYVRVPFISRA